MASMTRKEFVTLTVTLVGGGTLAAACSSSSTSGTGGAGGGSSTGGAGGSTSGAGGSMGAASCMNPLPEMQLPDSTMHVHTFTVTTALLAATMPLDLQTGPFPVGSGGHIHGVTLSVANLTTLKGGGSVTVTSTMAGTPAHSHMYMVSCLGD